MCRCLYRRVWRESVTVVKCGCVYSRAYSRVVRVQSENLLCYVVWQRRRQKVIGESYNVVLRADIGSDGDISPSVSLALCSQAGPTHSSSTSPMMNGTWEKFPAASRSCGEPGMKYPSIVGPQNILFVRPAMIDCDSTRMSTGTVWRHCMTPSVASVQLSSSTKRSTSSCHASSVGTSGEDDCEPDCMICRLS